MEITEKEYKVASEIFELIASELGEKRAIHPGTAITSCARLSGSFLFRSFEMPIENISPGNVVLSERANEKGPELINLLFWTLSNLGVNMDKEKINGTSKTESNLNFIDTLNLLQNKAVKIMNQHELSYEQLAYSCAMATAFIINECQHELAVESGIDVAIYSFVEATKTYPPELVN